MKYFKIALKFLSNPHLVRFELRRALVFLKNEYVNRIIVQKYAEKKNFFFIQIGANDGVRADPINKWIRQYHWQGILIEPQKDVFEKLKKNYEQHTNLIFENLAISKKTGTTIFYKSPKSGLSSLYPDEWFKGRNQIGSISAYNNRIKAGSSKKIKVRTMPFSNLLKKYSVTKIDFLMIDTEGYDYEIIKQINFSKIKPRMIRYEDHHLPKKEQKECILLLKSVGYSVIKLAGDTFAYR